jgi:hypothetical protein
MTRPSGTSHSVKCACPFLALVVAIALVALASGCGDKGDGKEVLTTADVEETFADQGLSLEDGGEILRGVPSLRYPGGSDGATQRIVCMVLSGPASARVYVKKAAGAGNISQAFAAKNVAVLVLPAANTDDVERTLSAAAELRRS